MKKLVVNGDDFGFTHDVNAGIIDAHVHGILTSTTLMTNGTAFVAVLSLVPNSRSNTTRGLFSAISGNVGVRHDSVLLYAQL